MNIFDKMDKDWETMKDAIENMVSKDKEVEGLSGEESFLANLEAQQATRVCDECGKVGGHYTQCVKCE